MDTGTVTMELIRATRIKVDADLSLISRTVQVWNAACNWISRAAFEHGCLTNPVRLHQMVYADARVQFGLSSQVTINAIRTVSSKYAALKKLKRIPRRPIRFRDDCAVQLQGGIRGRDFSFTRHGLSITTIDGRIKGVPFHGEARLDEYFTSWTLGDGRLYIRNGKAYLVCSFKCRVAHPGLPDRVVGVDRGIRYLAVATDGTKQLFFGGGHVTHVRDRYLKTRASLQSRKAQAPTRSLRRVLQRLSGREKRFMTNENHRISRRIADFAPHSMIAMEDLKGIRNHKLRKCQRGRLHRWAFSQLEDFIAYKTASVGSVVLSVDAAYTSQACSRCGYTERANRQRLTFSCRACGFSLHSDLNGARNIRLRGLLARQTLSQDGLPSISPEARPANSGWNPDEGTGKLSTSVESD